MRYFEDSWTMAVHAYLDVDHVKIPLEVENIKRIHDALLTESHEYSICCARCL